MDKGSLMGPPNAPFIVRVPKKSRKKLHLFPCLGDWSSFTNLYKEIWRVNLGHKVWGIS